jgi:pimeloyl-ACP methyl ester carboxylesterase
VALWDPEQGLAALAYATRYPELARAAIAIDVPITSSERRNRYLKRLRALPTVLYPDLATAMARFRLMPDEGGIAPEIFARIAEKSLARTVDGHYTMKFDRDSFFGRDGIDVPDAIRRITIPLLLVRAEMSRIMTADAAALAAASNPLARLVTIPAAHHHVLLERPGLLAAGSSAMSAGKRPEGDDERVTAGDARRVGLRSVTGEACRDGDFAGRHADEDESTLAVGDRADERLGVFLAR